MRLYKIKKSKIDRNGLYANRDIKKGTKIIEYKGKIISVKKSEENPKFDNGKAIYLFNINKRYDLDGDFKFNTARLIIFKDLMTSPEYLPENGFLVAINKTFFIFCFFLSAILNLLEQ